MQASGSSLHKELKLPLQLSGFAKGEGASPGRTLSWDACVRGWDTCVHGCAWLGHVCA